MSQDDVGAILVGLAVWAAFYVAVMWNERRMLDLARKIDRIRDLRRSSPLGEQ